MFSPYFTPKAWWHPGHNVFERASQLVIIASMVVLCLSTMTSLPDRTIGVLGAFDTVFGIAFGLEYGLRIAKANDRKGYLLSPWGMIDFIAVVPSLLIGGVDLRALRIVRLLRLARLLKLYRTSQALQRLAVAMHKIRHEFVACALLSFLIFFVASVGIYIFENQAQPDAFPSIPASMWWAVATLTTVGYGDVYPITVGGRIFTTAILLVGLGLVAVPTGLIAAALQNETDDGTTNAGTNGAPQKDPPPDISD